MKNHFRQTQNIAYILLFLFVVADTAIAQDTTIQTPSTKTNVYADTMLRANPDGIMAIVGANYQKNYQVDSNYNIPLNKIGRRNRYKSSLWSIFCL